MAFFCSAAVYDAYEIIKLREAAARRDAAARTVDDRWIAKRPEVYQLEDDGEDDDYGARVEPDAAPVPEDVEQRQGQAVHRQQRGPS